MVEGKMPQTPDEFVQVGFLLLLQVHQGLYGVHGTDEKGLCGDLKCLKDDLKNLSEKVEKIETAQLNGSKQKLLDDVSGIQSTLKLHWKLIFISLLSVAGVQGIPMITGG